MKAPKVYGWGAESVRISCKFGRRKPREGARLTGLEADIFFCLCGPSGRGWSGFDGSGVRCLGEGDGEGLGLGLGVK